MAAEGGDQRAVDLRAAGEGRRPRLDERRAAARTASAAAARRHRAAPSRSARRRVSLRAQVLVLLGHAHPAASCGGMPKSGSVHGREFPSESQRPPYAGVNAWRLIDVATRRIVSVSRTPRVIPWDAE